jgi:hypothetical protein
MAYMLAGTRPTVPLVVAGQVPRRDAAIGADLALSLVHPAHSGAAVRVAAGRFLLLLGNLGDQRFRRQQQ